MLFFYIKDITEYEYIMNKSLNIVFSCDQKYIKPLITIINSIITNRSGNYDLVFNIVCDEPELFMKNFEILKTVNHVNNFSFNCVSLKDSLEKEEIDFILKYTYSSNPDTNSIYNFSRFWFAKLFPELDYIIYLDIDMIIEGDIFELAGFNFNDDKFFAAVCGTVTKQYRISNMNISDILLDKFKINNNNLAFNAGLFVTSLYYWKKNDILSKLKELMCFRFDNKNVYKHGTQAPLNIIFHHNVIDITDKNWMVSSLGWNAGPQNEAIQSINSKKAKCLHWTGPKKPWNINRINDIHFREIYLKYCLDS